MIEQLPATPPTREDLEQMPKSVLVELVLRQQKLLEELIAKVERLQGQLDKDCLSSSKPPSSDLIKRSEKKSATETNSSDSSKRKPGGQPGHKGKTRKGFGRIDRYEVVEPIACELCGGHHFEESGASTRSYVVAQLVERPIEIVEYRQVRRVCRHCGTQTAGELPANIILGLD